MKKRRLRADRAARREAYYEELRKLNVLDRADNSDLTKAQLIKKLEEMGIEANMKMTKNELLKLFSKENNDEENINQVTEQNEEDTISNKKLKEPTQNLKNNNSNEEDGSIEEIEIDEVAEINTDNTVEEVTEQVIEQNEESEEIEV